MNKKLMLGLMSTATLIALMGAGCGSTSTVTTQVTPTPTTQTGGSSTSTGTTTPTAITYSMADIQKHNSATSCWAAVNGGVYDLTNWINQHPGGPEAIMSLCGTDGSNAFNDQHGGQRRPENELAGFKIGTLKP